MAKRKKKTTDLGYWLESSLAPVFVVDVERRIRTFNAGCEALTGWTAGELVGETCHYGSVSEIAGAAALASGLCPPPEALGGEKLTAPVHLVHKDGHALARLAHFFPIHDEKERLTGVLGIIFELPPAGQVMEVSPARQLHAELAALRSNLRSRFGPGTIVARSMIMRRILGQVELALTSQAFVLFSGAPGTGKEHLARVVHFGGAGHANWFVPLDCRRLGPDELHRVWNRILESSPTGTGARTLGASLPGTVFLADVEFMPRDLQDRLVNFCSQPGPLRLLASTAQSLPELVSGEQVRPDFYAMISPLTIELPALASRPDDLPLLAQHFLEELNRQEPRQIGGFDEEVWPLLARYDWPGNLDELAAVVREAHAHATGTVIRPGDLPNRFRTALAAQELPPPPQPPPMLLDALLTKLETRLIRLALARSRNNKSRAAEMLGINRARLLRRIEQLRIGSREVEADDAGEEVAEPDVLAEKTEP
jgi:DNA-binding NtrC family response regulator